MLESDSNPGTVLKDHSPERSVVSVVIGTPLASWVNSKSVEISGWPVDGMANIVSSRSAIIEVGSVRNRAIQLSKANGLEMESRQRFWKTRNRWAYIHIVY